MQFLNLILNIAWLVLGGFVMALGWLVASVVMALTIIGLPWARAAFNIAAYTLLPFGSRAVSRAEVHQRTDLGTGWIGTVGNIVWLVLAGWWLALLHVVLAFGYFITIIGIPFCWAHLKLAKIALWPIGRSVVSIDELRRVRNRFGH